MRISPHNVAKLWFGLNWVLLDGAFYWAVNAALTLTRGFDGVWDATRKGLWDEGRCLSTGRPTANLRLKTCNAFGIYWGAGFVCARECNVLWVKGIYKKRDAPRRIPLRYGLVGVLQLDGVHYEAVGGNFHGHFLAYLHIFLYRADGVLVVVVLVVQAAAQDCLYGIGLN